MRHTEMTRDNEYIGEKKNCWQSKRPKTFLSILERSQSSNTLYPLSYGDGRDNNNNNK